MEPSVFEKGLMIMIR